MKAHKYASKYAKMFINSVGLDDAPKAISELSAINSLMSESPEFKNLLLNPAFDSTERTAALGALGSRLSFSDKTVKFVGFLTEAKAAAAMGKVLQSVIAIYLDRKKKVRATVVTSAGLDRAYEGRLKESLKKATGKDVELEYATDPALLGGMLIKVGSTMYDGSIRGQLRLLRDELVKG